MPPIVPPLPTLACHNISPLRSGSIAYAIPDFCPSSSARRPLLKDTSAAEEAKSKSGPSESGQFTLPVSGHELFHASPAVSCLDHKIRPVDICKATTASLNGVGGSE